MGIFLQQDLSKNNFILFSFDEDEILMIQKEYIKFFSDIVEFKTKKFSFKN